MAEQIDTVVIGAGQAGIAMSEHLRASGEPHLVLERARIAERWRSERWDSLVMNGPAWHDRFPNMTFPTDPDGFPSKDDVVTYFEAYAKMIDCPLRCGVSVQKVARHPGQGGFQVSTSEGEIEARNVVVATGPFQRPMIPPLVPDSDGLTQIHSSAYRNPSALPHGAVLVVGAGSSGAQIADELRRSGREVYLSIGAHDRPPRQYRGRDYCWWLGVLGLWDLPAPHPGTEHVTISVSGAEGGKTIDFRNFGNRGITLLGMTQSYADGVLQIADDLAGNIARGDANYLSVLDQADAYATRLGLELPDDPEARVFEDMPACVTKPLHRLDLAEAGIRTIIWATGYGVDFGWIKPDVLDAKGRPVHQRGVTAEPGLYFLGMPWQSRRGSAFVWGVWHDAKYLADQIAIQRSYRDYHLGAAAKAPD